MLKIEKNYREHMLNIKDICTIIILFGYKRLHMTGLRVVIYWVLSLYWDGLEK